MNSTELIAVVRAKIKDASFTDTEILALLNEAYLKVAHDLCLPGLQAIDELVFSEGGDSFADLPADYHHDLWHATNDTEPWQEVRVHTSLHSLQRIFKNEYETGYIRDIAVEGAVLHVRPAPSMDQVVKFWYYKQPTLLVIPAEGGAPSVPEGIPAHLHGPVLAYYAVSKLYDEIEDGVDGNKTNTNNWEMKWKRDGFDALAATKSVKHAGRLEPYVKRHARFL